MSKLTADIMRALKRSKLSNEEIVAAIDAGLAPKSEPKPEPRKRTYQRRDMQAEK